MTPDAGGTGETGVDGWRTGTGDGDDGTSADGPGDEADRPTVRSSDASTDPASHPPAAVESKVGEGLGWRGWVLVGWLAVAMVVVPWALVFLPQLQGVVESVGLGLRDAYLVLPMVPALGLGILAVWAAVRSRQSD
jgi:hypothetical protein